MSKVFVNEASTSLKNNYQSIDTNVLIQYFAHKMFIHFQF